MDANHQYHQTISLNTNIPLEHKKLPFSLQAHRRCKVLLGDRTSNNRRLSLPPGDSLSLFSSLWPLFFFSRLHHSQSLSFLFPFRQKSSHEASSSSSPTSFHRHIPWHPFRHPGFGLGRGVDNQYGVTMAAPLRSCQGTGYRALVAALEAEIKILEK